MMICICLILSYSICFLSRLKCSVWISKANEYIHYVDMMFKQCTLRVKDLKLFETMYHIPEFICTHFFIYKCLNEVFAPWLILHTLSVMVNGRGFGHYVVIYNVFSRFLHFLPFPRNPPSEKWGEWISINQLHFVCAWQRTGKKRTRHLKNKLPRLPVCVQKGRSLSCSNQNMN